MNVWPAVAAVILATACWFRFSKEGREHESPPPAGNAEGGQSTEAATRAFLLYALIPFWMLPGVGDYMCHRRSHIESTSGTHESLTHALMIATTGVEIGAGLLFDVNETVIAIMAAAALAHEAIVIWDVAYASKLRPPSPTEQHLHSFLEVLPFTSLAFTICRHPHAAKRLVLQRGRIALKLNLKREPEPPQYFASIALLSVAMLVLPYAEEFVRCFRYDRTLLPHTAE